MNNDLEYIEKFNRENVAPKFVVIWLHGLGASCEDFLPIVPQLNLNFSMKFVFPNAPMRSVALNNGYVMRAWYNIYTLDLHNHRVDESGIKESLTQIYKLIDKQIEAGFSVDKIILAGFSQGGVISYYAGLSNEYKLGGVLVLSGYLPEPQLISNLNKEVPVFACHGTNDMVVPYKAGLNAYEYLYNNGCNIYWHEYSMMHSVCDEEIIDITNWLNSLDDK